MGEDYLEAGAALSVEPVTLEVASVALVASVAPMASVAGFSAFSAGAPVELSSISALMGGSV